MGGLAGLGVVGGGEEEEEGEEGAARMGLKGEPVKVDAADEEVVGVRGGTSCCCCCCCCCTGVP